MSFGPPEPLGPDHVLEGFESGKPTLDDWLLRRAVRNQASGASRTWVVADDSRRVVADDSRRVVAYYASATASIIRSSATSRAARNQPEEIPAILLARLAVDARHQGRGLGSALLKHFALKALEVGEIVGLRVLLVHAMDAEARSFYEHFDFEPSPNDEMTLMKVVQDIL